MEGIGDLLDQVYVGQERRSREEIYARAVAAGLPSTELTRLDALPDGEYTADEVLAALSQFGQEPASDIDSEPGIPAADLSDDDLTRELEQLHRTRHETFLHGSAQALLRHSERLGELEAEYLNRFPARDVEPERLRAGARERS
jgi:Family of unknown function (DUF6158)